ncbi:hypothetical protein [Rhizobium sp. MHM7A]|uniref:hypothetical protein n=1 Tax=Rhizobium sp. MHM7A TaxID=2583233 RepID=UPI001105CAA1|nr:hypothetical protein [Rhizobium sp. MHM7A]TLX16763.1 hypothetical protein FFR93_05310 [Rhizobium sp. MHM7A]
MTSINPEMQHNVPDEVPQGAILLRMSKGDNAYKALVENSFSMDWKTDSVRFFWSGKAYSILGTHELDGFQDAEDQRAHYQSKYPDDVLTVFDVRDPNLPIIIDWEEWQKNREHGRQDDRRWRKFLARNPSFKMKD